MQNPLAKTPFLSLLIPLAIGILLQYYLDILYISPFLLVSGAVVIAASYFSPFGGKFPYRWVFGLGCGLFLVGTGIVSTHLCQNKAAFTFHDGQQVYRGIVTDIAQEKPRSTAYRVHLPDHDKQIVCYFQPDSLRSRLLPGDEFLFEGTIQPFRNAGNPDDFDYERHMYNQKYAGSAYVPAYAWMPTGEVSSSVRIKAQRFRSEIIRFYQHLGFDKTEYTILAALTLGHQDGLSDDLKQSFRATGTAHVLSVSGLHVGIIYAMISFLLGFIKIRSRFFWIKPVLIIIVLWIYAFITGLPPSVIRASAMLTVFCLSQLFHRKGYSPNALYIAAFFMLLADPFSLFDVGFQLSFISVLAILYLHPKAVAMKDIKNKSLRYTWQMFTLSVVAQLGTFPLCLYYFGTFPTYFFISNLIVVPLVTLITYSMAGIVLAKLASYALPAYALEIFYLPVKGMKLLVESLTSVIRFFEQIPFAIISDIKVSFPILILIIVAILCFLDFLVRKRNRMLIASLAALLAVSVSHLYHNLCPEPDRLVIYNRQNTTEMYWQIAQQGYRLTDNGMKEDSPIYSIGGHTLLILDTDNYENKEAPYPFSVDILLLRGNRPYSMATLTRMFSAGTIVLDGSLPNKSTRQLVNYSQKHRIRCYDITQKGAFTLFF